MRELASKLHRGLKHPVSTRVLNSLAFYGVFGALIGFAALGKPGEGILILLAWSVVHFLLSHQRRKDAIFLCSMVVFGTLIEIGYLSAGVLTYASPNPLASWLPPVWMLGIYLLYGMAVDYSLFWLHNRFWLAAIFGCGGGIASYRVGVAVGAAEFLLPGYQSYIVIGAVWALFCPFSCWYSRWMDVRLVRSAES